MFRVLCAGLCAAAVALSAGCDKKSAATTEIKGKGHDHSDHDRKGAKIEDITLPGGTYHAGLTAHLSKEPGKNELDVFFETTDGKPHPLPLGAKITARVTRKGDDTPHSLEFKPAEKDERKGDPDDKCSRFTAEAPWMKPDDVLSVTLVVELDKKESRCPFIDFVPSKFAHEHD